MREHAPGPPPPLPSWHESKHTSLQGYLRAWYVIFGVKKEKPPFFLLFFGFRGGGGGVIAPQPPPPPLEKCECIYFCTDVRIWIDLGEKYGTKIWVVNLLS